MIRFVLGELQRAVEQRFVRDDLLDLDAAGRGQDESRLGVVDPGRELFGGEAAEYDRVDRADARAGQHGHRGLGDHRHVDDDPVAFLYAQAA